MASIEKRATFAVCLAALLTLPLSVIADDQGQHGGGNGGGSVSRVRETTITVRTATVTTEEDSPTGNNPNAGGSGAPVLGTNNQNPQPQRIRVTLAVTDAGDAIGASGNADLRAQGREQRPKVEMEANVPDGTMFTLLANNSPIGTITIQLGEGEFELTHRMGRFW